MISEKIVASSSILHYRFYRWSFHTTRLQNDTKVRRLKTIPLTNPYVERLTSWWGAAAESIFYLVGAIYIFEQWKQNFSQLLYYFQAGNVRCKLTFLSKKLVCGNYSKYSNCNPILDIKFDSHNGGIRNCHISVMYNDLKMDDRQKHQSDFFPIRAMIFYGVRKLDN